MTVGEDIDIVIDAFDARGLTAVGATVTDGGAFVVPLAMDPAGETSVSHTFTVPTPGINIEALTVTPYASDVNANDATGEPVVFSLVDQQGPTILRLETSPDSTIPLGDSVQVIVDLSDPAGIKQVTFIGLAYRGDPSMGTDEVIERFTQKTITFPRPTEGFDLPTEYTLDPFLVSTDLLTNEPVEIFVIAEDSLGNVSDTTKVMFVGGPHVSMVYPPEDFAVGIGAAFDVVLKIDDPTGIDSAKVVLSGGKSQVIPLTLPARTDTPFVLTQNVVMPASETTVDVQARAWNTSDVGGLSPTRSVQVMAEPPSDTIPPIVSVTAERISASPTAGERMELLDEIRITVTAYDANAGVERVGMKAVASRGGVQHVITEDTTFASTLSLTRFVVQIPIDSLYARFGITDPAEVEALLPEDIDLRIHGFAADAVDQVACSVGEEEQRRCSPSGYLWTEFYEAADTAGLVLGIEAVRGVTVLLDNRDADIADLAVDTVDDRLFLSNKSYNLVEFLQLDADFRAMSFYDPVQVGSEPNGIFLGERSVSSDEVGFGGISVTPGTRARTLVVANSGGTNMSYVHLDPNPSLVQEVDVVRLRTPNSVLYQVQESEDEFGYMRFLVSFFDLSDRPQYLAQDSLLRIVYSTLPTPTAPTATVRYVHADPDPLGAGDEPEVRFLLTGDMVDTNAAGVLALANIDSIGIMPLSGADDSVRIYTHAPGYPDNVIYNTTWRAQFAQAAADVIAQIDLAMGGSPQASMFYPFLAAGRWDLEALGWSDQTFVSASGDRGKIVLGEGRSSPTGRIMMWHGNTTPDLSDEIEIADLLSNASEQVLGVGLNQNGSLGVARGREATYFFTPDLRLQGLYRQEHTGGAGAAFHPEHDAVTDGGHTDTELAGMAFTGTSNHSIDVVNTYHFDRTNSLTIRDDIVGPLVSGPPLASDNGGQGGQCVALAATEAEREVCVVAKLYGITSAGGVVVVNVRRRDLMTP
jgi:hypothetical protein